MQNVFEPHLREEEAEAVRQVMLSNWVGRGKLSTLFEAEFAKHIGVNPENLLSITSCTEGLFLSMELLGIGPGDLVIMPTISFVGAANAVVAAGARPIFCDVDRRTLNVTAENIVDCIRRLKYVRKDRIRAILLLHYGGVPCDMQEIMSLSIMKDIPVIEDSACSPSSRNDEQACGTFGTIGLWSFDSMKILSMADGGMLYTENKAMRLLAEKRGFLGLTNASGLTSAAAEWWGVDIDLPGRRFLMNDLNAAIGLEQLKKLPRFIDRRREIDGRYRMLLSGCKELLLPPPIPKDSTSSYYLFWIQLESEEARTGLANYLRTNGVYTTFRYYPLHWVRYYKERFPQHVLPGAEWAARRTLCLPIHQGLEDCDVDKVCELIIGFLRNQE